MSQTLIQKDGEVIANGKRYKVPKGGATVVQNTDGLWINGEQVEDYKTESIIFSFTTKCIEVMLFSLSCTMIALIIYNFFIK
jgi:hypothetical protein